MDTMIESVQCQGLECKRKRLSRFFWHARENGGRRGQERLLLEGLSLPCSPGRSSGVGVFCRKTLVSGGNSMSKCRDELCTFKNKEKLCTSVGHRFSSSHLLVLVCSTCINPHSSFLC